MFVLNISWGREWPVSSSGCISTPHVGELHGGILSNRNQQLPQEVWVCQCSDARPVEWTHGSLGRQCSWRGKSEVQKSLYCSICPVSQLSEGYQERIKNILSVIFSLILLYSIHYYYPYCVSAILFSLPCYSLSPGRCWSHHEYLDPADGLPCGDSEALSPGHLHSLPGTLLAGPKCRIRVSF